MQSHDRFSILSPGAAGEGASQRRINSEHGGVLTPMSPGLVSTGSQSYYQGSQTSETIWTTEIDDPAQQGIRDDEDDVFVFLDGTLREPDPDEHLDCGSQVG